MVSSKKIRELIEKLYGNTETKCDILPLEKEDYDRNDPFLFCCSVCNETQSMTYTIINEFLKNKKSYCLNSLCKYYKIGRKMFSFDINKIYNKIGQKVNDYKTINKACELECMGCGNKRNVILTNITFGCENIDCEWKTHGYNRKTKEYYEDTKTNYSKKLNYEKIVSDKGFKLLQSVSTIQEKTILECPKQHQFETNLNHFIEYHEGKKTILCNKCYLEDIYNKVKNKLPENYELISKIYDIETIDSNMIIKCNNNHLLSCCVLNIINNIFDCHFCKGNTQVHITPPIIKIKTSTKTLQEKVSYTKGMEYEELKLDDDFDISRYFTFTNNILTTYDIPVSTMISLRKKMKDNPLLLESITRQFCRLTKNQPFIFIKYEESELEKKLLRFLNQENVNSFSVKQTSDTVFKMELNDNTKYFIISNPVGNDYLNHFVCKNICTATVKNTINIIDLWNNDELKYKLIRRGLSDIQVGGFSPSTFIQRFSYKYQRVYNFPPNVARAIYNFFNSKRVLDFSSGYAGRLLGFWGSDAEEYIGIDPNNEVCYNKIIEHLTKNSCEKKARVFCSPAEDFDFTTIGYFDTVFTSPPYFNLEVYQSSNENQSCIRYKKYKEWLTKFLFVVLDKSISVLSDNGILAINIKDIDNFSIAKDMNNYLRSKKELLYKFDILLFQPKKFKTNKQEYIYVYQKINK